MKSHQSIKTFYPKEVIQNKGQKVSKTTQSMHRKLHVPKQTGLNFVETIYS